MLAVLFNATLQKLISVRLAQLQEQQDVPINPPHAVIIQS